MKNIKLLPTILLISFLFLLNSCKNCDPDINLGNLNLTATSLQFVPYTGNEVLTFVNDSGNEFNLRSDNGWESMELRLIVATLCDESFLDKQYMQYIVTDRSIVFLDQNGRQVFYINQITQAEDSQNTDQQPIFDVLSVISSPTNNFNSRITIVTDEQQNSISDNFRNNVIMESRFIGDTTLYEKDFEGVYTTKTEKGDATFYNKERGILAYTFSEGGHWILKD